MPWRPLPRIAFAVAIYPFQPSTPADLPLELGDELYIIEQGGVDGEWCRGYLVAPPSLLAGLTSTKGQTLEARVFSGVFPRNCVEIREVLGDGDGDGHKALTNGNHSTEDADHDVETDLRSSLASFQDDENAAGEVSDVVVAKKEKASQIIIQRVDDDDMPTPRVLQTSPFGIGSPPHTPVTLAPRDPNAPKPPAPVPMLKIGDETPTSISEPLVDEIASCLREWHSTNLHELLLSQQYQVVEEMSNIVQELDFARRQLLYNVLTAQEKETLRQEVVWKLVRGNKLLGGEVIVRDPQQRGRLLTGDDSAIQLAKLQSEMSMLDNSPIHPSDTAALHHLLLEVNAVSGNSPGPVTLAAYLCSQSETGALKALSETYILDIPSPEQFANSGQATKLKTLFTELGSTDIGDGSTNSPKLYLVVAVRAPEVTSAPPIVIQQAPSISRDGPVPTRQPTVVNTSTKGTLKTRRSMMWSSKPRGIHSAEQSKETPKAPPQSSGSVSSNKEKSPQPVKESTQIRTIGVGLLEVSQVLRQDKDVEQVVNIWSPSEKIEDTEGYTEGFDGLIRTLLPTPSGKYVRSPQAARIHLHLYPYVDSDPDALIKRNPTVMHNVAQTRRIGFSQAPTKPRSDIYVTISHATFPPEALLSHPLSGQVPMPAHTELHNLQLTLEVRAASGARVDKCIFAASNHAPHTAWRTTIADRGKPWNQTIRLNIPTDQIPGSHLIMSVADAPEFPFALSWMPLWDNQAFIRDGPHSLLLHSYDKHTSNIENGKGAYLSLPWSSLWKNESAKDEAITGPLATLLLETHLCSTEYSQDQVMLSLLNWKERSVNEVLDTLKRVLFVPEMEIVKQVSSVFDALFAILVENAGNEEYEDLIFHNLVTVLGIVHDRRFNLGPLVDHYTENQFNFPFATPCLMRSYLRLLQAHSDPQQSRNLRATVKVGRHVLKFIINAREQQKAKEEGIGITRVQSTFNRDLHTIFKSLEALMKNPSPAMIGSKTLVVQHFHTWLPELSKVLGKDEMIMIALSFIDSCNDVKGMLVLYKLVLIQHYTRLEIFSSGSERQSLVSSCIGWLEPYWGATGAVSDLYRDQVRLSCAIIAELLTHPDPQLYQLMPTIVSSYYSIIPDGVDDTSYLSLLFSKSFPFQLKASKSSQKFDEVLVELAAILAGIASIPNPKSPRLKGPELANFVSQAFEVHNSILNCEPYPRSWFSVHVYNHRATVKSLEYLASTMINNLLPAPDDAETFDTRLWESFFMTLLKVVSSDALALETVPEQKRRTIWKIAGDVREQGADLLHSTWEAIGWETSEEEREHYGLKKLGGYQVQYVPGLVAPIIELCLCVHEGLRHVAVEILRTMILSEWGLNEDLSIIETEIISSLDNLFKSKNMNESIIQKLFIGELLGCFEGYSSFDEDLFNAVKALIATVDELLDLFVASQGGSMAESLHSLRLMEYMKDMGREDIFIRYVHELSETQAAAGNFTEAGLSLQFHADLYDWDPRRSVPELVNPSFPEQTSFERKEALYFSVIQHFEDAKAWTHALACYKELAMHYEETVMDFAKLSRAQGSMARIHESIAKEDKAFPRYFRVLYKGLGFPPTLRDKEFIVECSPSERMATLIDRMQKEHPAAQVVSSSEVHDYEGQFLHINPVSVHRDMTHPVYQRSKVPPSVRDHLLVSEPTRFTSTLKRHIRDVDVQEQWVEKVIYTTSEPFPNILRRSEVVTTERVALSPLQTALERTWRKTQELYLLYRRAVSGEDISLTNLTEALEQLLELTSPSSCVAHYRVFLSDVPDEDDDDANTPKPVDPLKNALAVALIDHALAIKHALAMYSRPAYQATQAELTRRFEEAFAPELTSLRPVEMSTTSVPQRQSPASSETLQFPRTISPEQELIRASRKNSQVRRQNSVKQSVSHRISIMNPFKRNHGASNSVATIQTNSKVNGHGAYCKGEDASDRDDDAVTVHSRTTNRSRDTNHKRRSFFGDVIHKHASSLSIAASTTGDETKSQKRQRSRSGTRDTAAKSQENITRTNPRPNGIQVLEDRSPSIVTSPKGGWSTIPSVTEHPRPVTRSSVTSAKSPAVRSPSGQTNATSSTSGGGVRDSVLKRFSLLKGVGRKTSRLDFRSDPTVHEE